MTGDINHHLLYTCLHTENLRAHLLSDRAHLVQVERCLDRGETPPPDWRKRYDLAGAELILRGLADRIACLRERMERPQLARMEAAE